MTYRLHFYRDRSVKREWRWKLYATNGKCVATAGEGFKNRTDCVKIAHKLFPLVPRS